MIYLTADDFKPFIKDEVLDAVLQSQPVLLDSVELQAMKQVESYLNQRYDIAAIWATTGADRDPLIIMYLVDMALYHLHSRISKREMPEARVDRYNMAINWLKEVSKGLLTPLLPKQLDPNTNDYEETYIIKSNPKLGHQW